MNALKIYPFCSVGQGKLTYCRILLVFLSAPPTIKGPSETSELSVVLGFPIVLQCDVEGSPTPSITWLKDSLSIVSSPQLTYSHDGQSLRLGSAQGDSTGLYTCRATNLAGTATKHYSLSVLGMTHPHCFKIKLKLKRMFDHPSVPFPVCSPTTDRRRFLNVWHSGRESTD